MQNDFSRGGNDNLDGLESQEVDISSEVSVCLIVLSFCLAMWNADMKLEKQGLRYLTLFSCAMKVFEVYQSLYVNYIYVALVTALPSVRCCL